VTCFPDRDDNDFWILQEVNLPSNWKPSFSAVPVSDAEIESLGGNRIPFAVLLCCCAGSSVLAVKCDVRVGDGWGWLGKVGDVGGVGEVGGALRVGFVCLVFKTSNKNTSREN
jgi:hypothetical protein